MKRLGWGILAFISVVSISMQSVSAEIGIAPSNELPIKINGPFLITGYSFSGHSVRYVQIHNSSSNVESLAGWKVGYEVNNLKYDLLDLHGSVAPRQYVTVANNVIMPSATFTYSDLVVPAMPVLSSIRLVPPAELNMNEEIVSPAITSSTVNIVMSGGLPAAYYFTRTTSASSGNYNTGFMAFIPPSMFTLASDGLYTPPNSPGVTVVEIYPDAPTCAPSGSATCSDYIKLFNGSNETIDLSKFRLRTGVYGQSATSSNTVQLNGLLAPGHYSSFPITLSSSGSWVWLEDKYEVMRYDQSIVGYPSSSGHDAEAWSYNPLHGTWEWTIYPQPGNVANQFAIPASVNMCEGLIVSEIAANVASEDQFIEIRNASDGNLVIDGCILQTNRSTTKSYVLSGSLISGEMQTIYIKDTLLTLTKTTSGTVYILSSDKLVEVNSVSYEDLAENTSVALIGEVWLQTYAVTPNLANVWQEYPACDYGYYRNEETGYCNKVQGIAEQTDCGEGKYRNSETNRCRNIETASSLLAPCAFNQVRNPDTNRCRTITAASTPLKSCAANQERNPTTNRCRNKSAIIKADFPVEAARQATDATLGWWAFGGVGMLALGYAGWEWRNEIVNAIKKSSSFIPGRH